MINRPSLEKKRKFAIELQKQREVIIAKHIPIAKKVYKHIIKDIINNYKLKQPIKNIIDNYKAEISLMITNIYRDSYKKFARHFRNNIAKEDKKSQFKNLYYEIKNDTNDIQFELSLEKALKQYANIHSDYILNTFYNDFSRYEKLAFLTFAKQYNEQMNELSILNNSSNSIFGNFFLRNKINKLTQDIQDNYKNRESKITDILGQALEENVLQQRAEAVATQETLFSESFTRQKEAEYISQTNKSEVLKEWNSIFKETTRLTHAEASGQIKKVNELFLVKNPKTFANEYGLEPKDENFSLENKINCYCFIIYFLEEKDEKRGFR